MDPKTAKELIKAHEALRDLYHKAANEACSSNNTYDVYMHMRDVMGQETRIRHLKNRYQSN